MEGGRSAGTPIAGVLRRSIFIFLLWLELDMRFLLAFWERETCELRFALPPSWLSLPVLRLLVVLRANPFAGAAFSFVPMVLADKIRGRCALKVNSTKGVLSREITRKICYRWGKEHDDPPARSFHMPQKNLWSNDRHWIKKAYSQLIQKKKIIPWLLASLKRLLTKWPHSYDIRWCFCTGSTYVRPTVYERYQWPLFAFVPTTCNQTPGRIQSIRDFD